MTSRPILFSAPMVRALLDGRKTQTQRAVKPMAGQQQGWLMPRLLDSVRHVEIVRLRAEDGGDLGAQLTHPMSRKGDPLGWVRCPYGQPGDELYVKETWRPLPGVFAPHDWRDVEWRASPPHVSGPRWRSPLHLPRALSRITLRVTSVGVERLQAISEADAMAEGIESVLPIDGDSMRTYRDYLGSSDPCEWFGRPRDSYRSLWESINGAGSWAANPWVWVISVERKT
jgi:hypothetical protein